jgi:hypothetical protein
MNTNKINKINTVNTLNEFSFENVMIKNRGLSEKLPMKLYREIKNGTPVAKLLDTLCFFMIRTLQTMRKMEQYPGYTWENYKKYCGIIEPLIRQLYSKYHVKTTVFVKQNLMNIADNIQLIIGMNTGTGTRTGGINRNSSSKSKTLRRTNSSKNGGNNGNTQRNTGKPPSANKLRNTTGKVSNNRRTTRLKRYGPMNSGNFVGNSAGNFVGNSAGNFVGNKLKRTMPNLRSNSDRK